MPSSRVLKEVFGAAQFSPHGDYLVTLSQEQHQDQLRVWRVRDLKLVKTQKFESPVLALSFTPNQHYLAVGTQDGHYTRWNFPGFQHPLEIYDPPRGTESQPFALSPDGAYLALFKLASRSEGILDYHLNIWDLHQGPTRHYLHIDEIRDSLPGHWPTLQVAWHPQGRYLTTAMEWDEGAQPPVRTKVQVWDIWQQRWAYAVPGSVPISYSYRGPYFLFAVPASAYGPHFPYWNFKLWHTLANRLKTVPIPLTSPAMSAATLSPDGVYLAFLQEERNTHKQVLIMSTQSLTIVQSFQPPPGTDTLSFSPDHRWLAVSSQVEKDQPVTLFELKE